MFLAPNYAAPCAHVSHGEPLCQARAQRTKKRWRTGVLCPSPPKPALVTLVARVLFPEILRWARAREAARIWQCSVGWHGGGLFLAGALTERRQAVADSVASIFSFDATPAQALLEEGATGPDILRALASAWDWALVLPRGDILNLDERLLSMALARVAFKPLLRDPEDPVAADGVFAGAPGKLFSLSQAERGALCAMEARVLMLVAARFLLRG